MNLKEVENYDIGLDLGTGSVGWCVVDENGELCKFKGKPTWGSRIFQSAKTAKETRTFRNIRRRYNRRRWRLNLLQDFFANEIKKIDKDFFCRLNNSFRVKQDPKYKNLSFNEIKIAGIGNVKKYCKKFPTIYHLRKYLIETKNKVDIRLIYLAFHNIVKVRGNFLYQDNENLSSENTDLTSSINEFVQCLENYFNNIELDNSENLYKNIKSIIDKECSEKDKNKELKKAFDSCGLSKQLSKQLSNAIFGSNTDFKNIFKEDIPDLNDEELKFKLSDEEKVEKFRSAAHDDQLALFECLLKLYYGTFFKSILAYEPGKSISFNKVAQYDKYKEDLKKLKDLAKKYTDFKDESAKEKYHEFFNGEKYPNTNLYDKSKIKKKTYTYYNEVRDSKDSKYSDFKKGVKDFFKDIDATNDEKYKEIIDELENESFLRRLKTTDNVAIPYQLHLEELDSIIDNQSQYYPFLLENKDKIRSLVSFRIPYSVGPLTHKNAPKDIQGKERFAWSIRKEGMDNEKIYPWNFDEIIDKAESDEKFIKRMTKNCTYLKGESVLPKCSLLYEKFCLLNELNSMRFDLVGGDFRRLDHELHKNLIENFFPSAKSVTYNKIKDFIKEKRGCPNVYIKGAQLENGMNSKLSSYLFFKDIFDNSDDFHKQFHKQFSKVIEDDKQFSEAIENIILMSTIFEDRKTLKEQLLLKYHRDCGSVCKILNDDQIDKICKKRFKGWGRLSKKLLTEIKFGPDGNKITLIDALEKGLPIFHSPFRPMNFMEILHEDSFGHKNSLLEKIDQHNAKYLKDIEFDINDTIALLPGSPALKRPINQAIKIVQEIISITKKPPRYIFIENTRSDDFEKKGKRTETRKKQVSNLLEDLKKQYKKIYSSNLDKEFKQFNEKLDNDRLFLYFLQNGKCLYCEESLDINKLSSYHIDHIVPRFYITDNSIDNKVLCHAECNESKRDNLLIDSKIQINRKCYWKALKEVGGISEEKYNKLTCSEISDNRLKGFINRQLVETGQIVKNVQLLLNKLLLNKFPSKDNEISVTSVVPIKATLSSDLRKNKNLAKCREANDFHHAHDAFLATQIGHFILLRYPLIFKEPIKYAKIIKDSIKLLKENQNGTEKIESFNKFGFGSNSFFIHSFNKNGFNKDTGEVFKDGWDKDKAHDRILRTLNYKQCFISRMVEECTGEFWMQTIYSPRSNRNSMIPLSKDKKLEYYGGYSGKKPAFFTLFKAKDKDDNLKLFFRPVYIYKVNNSTFTIDRYLKEILNEINSEPSNKNKEFELFDIVIEKVYRNQVIEINGEAFAVVSNSELKPVFQIAYTFEQYRVLKYIFDNEKSLVGKDNDNEKSSRLLNDEKLKDIDSLYSFIKGKINNKQQEILNSKLKFDEYEEEFSKLDIDEKIKIILGIIRYINRVNSSIDFRSFHGKKYAAKLKLNLEKNYLNCREQNVAFINSSVTGMFQNRVKIEL